MQISKDFDKSSAQLFHIKNSGPFSGQQKLTQDGQTENFGYIDFHYWTNKSKLDRIIGWIIFFGILGSMLNRGGGRLCFPLYRR